MIRPSFFISLLKERDISFFSGVPDSLLKNICACITDSTDKKNNIIAANEGAAVGLGAGYYLSTGQIPMIYMQNSGLGNIVNPLLSLADQEVYSIPMLLLIGWRGKPGVKDEPQHVKQGRVTLALLEAMEIKYSVLSSNEDEASKQIDTAVAYMRKENAPYALVVEKGTFSDYALESLNQKSYPLRREEAIRLILKSYPDDGIVISTTGKISRELFELREERSEGHEKDFLTVGAMGHASQIALGIALNKSSRKVMCLDGDGALLMHGGSMAIIGDQAPQNFIHIVLNNGAHESVGGQPTVAFGLDLCKIALGMGYEKAYSIETQTEVREVLEKALKEVGPIFVEIKVALGARKDLGRPTTTPVENKVALMKFLKEN